MTAHSTLPAMLSHKASPRGLVVLSFAAIVICSIPVFGTRFLNDMDFYTLFADKLLSGGALYRDAMDTKPPLVFLHYALIFKIFGLDNVTAVKIVTMAWLGLCAMLMASLRKALAPTAAAPVLAATLFILASFSGWGEDFLSSNTELLANLFILLGVLLLVCDDFGRRPTRLLAAGASIGVAFLYRYQAGAALGAYAATMLLRRRQLDRTLLRLLWIGAGFFLPSLAFVAYYVHLGALSDLRLMLALQTHYARDPVDAYWWQLLARILTTLAGLWPVLLLAVWQAVAIARKWRTASPSEVFQLMFAAWSVATFFAGGRFFPHYFVQAIPPLVLLAAARLCCAADDADGTRAGLWSWFGSHAVAIMTTMAVLFAAINGAYYWTRKDKPSNPDLVAFVEAHCGADDRVLLWAWRPKLLIETKRVFATRLLVNSPLIGQLEPVPETARPRIRRPGLPELWPAFLRDLSASPPRIIIDDPPGKSDWRMEHYPQLAPIFTSYHPCQIMDGVCVYLRKA